MISVRENCERAKASVRYLSSLTTEAKNDMLRIAAEALVSSTNEILTANARDIAANSGMQQFLLDRLTLNEARVKSMSDGLMKLIELADKACRKVLPEIGTHIGRVVSGDQFISDKAVKERIASNFNGCCTEMEGAAIAQTAYLNKVPFVILRAISDKADDSATMDYPTFEKKAIENSVKLIKELVLEL